MRARVDAALKEAFEIRAKQLNKKPPELLREIVIRELGGEPGAVDGKENGQPTRSAGSKRYEVRIANPVVDAVEHRAREKGMTPARWLGALAQSHVVREPVMTEKEVLALRALTRELSALGRNVNQIAKALNSAFDLVERSRINLDDLLRLEKGIDVTKRVVRTLIHKSQLSWGTASDDAG